MVEKDREDEIKAESEANEDVSNCFENKLKNQTKSLLFAGILHEGELTEHVW